MMWGWEGRVPDTTAAGVEGSDGRRVEAAVVVVVVSRPRRLPEALGERVAGNLQLGDLQIEFYHRWKKLGKVLCGLLENREDN